jgi:hypothetical protein
VYSAAGSEASRAAIAAEPTYTSAALDTGSLSRFGSFRWRGADGAGGRAQFSFRSGLARDPDRTWSGWTDWSPLRAGSDLGLAGVPAGRYVQWRTRFDGEGAASLSIAAMELTYRAENARPRIRRFYAMEPGELLAPSSFSPANQVYEPAHPDRQGFFTPFAPATAGDETRWKTLWKKGHRTLRWEAEDSNQDRLEYRLEFRFEGAGSEGAWLPMAENLTETSYGFDETVLPDGLYRFRVRASDAAANPAGEGLEAERLSEPLLVDGSPPRLVRARRDGTRLRVEVEDAWNPLRAAQWSADGAAWEDVTTTDDLVDGRREEIVLEPKPGARFVLLRVTDTAFNVGTFDLSEAWAK